MSDDSPKRVKLVKRTDRVPAKSDLREELKRISDLQLTLSKRVRQLIDAYEQIQPNDSVADQ